MELCAAGKNLCALLALLLVLCIPGLSDAGVATEVVVQKSVLLNLQKPMERVSIAAPDIAELVVISPTQLQINGKKIGSTTLIVWDKGGKTSFFDIRVKGDVSLLENQIREIESPNDSVTVDYANDTIVLSGKVARERTKDKAYRLAQAYAAKGEGASAEAPDAQDKTEDSYQSEATSFYKEATPQKGNSEQSLKVINQIQVQDVQQILLEVKVAQVNKSALKDLGISLLLKGASAEGFTNLAGAAPFPNSALAPRFPNDGIAANSSGLGALNGVKDARLDPFQIGVSVFKPGIGALLKALASKNLAKVLAEPNLLVRSGQFGKFLAGQKIPYSVVTGVGALSTSSIEWKDVGVKVRFKPEVMENGLISLLIDPAEVSNLSAASVVNGYPLIDTREVHTKVQLKDGESLVLAGLLQEQTIKNMSKIPILGDIPILGALFRTTHDETTEQELVFFITPRLVAPNTPGTKVQLPTDKPLTPEQERELKWMPLVD